MDLTLIVTLGVFAPLIGAGEVLDLACGSGRHARHLAGLGHTVTALDRDLDALGRAAGAGIKTMLFDLERAGGRDWPFGAARFAGIVIANYLHRPLMAQVARSLAAHGVLIIETFAQGNAAFGKPSNPAFLLDPGELLAMAAQFGWRVVAYEDGRTDAPKAAMVQRLCAVGPGFVAENARLLPNTLCQKHQQ